MLIGKRMWKFEGKTTESLEDRKKTQYISKDQKKVTVAGKESKMEKGLK